MPWRSIKIFCRHYCHALHVGILSGAFGWGTTVAAVILAILGLPEMIQAWVQPLAIFGAAIALMFALHLLFIAPYRALRMLWPFSIEVIAGHLETPYPPRQLEPQEAALIVRNRSYLPLSDCVLHIMGADNANLFSQYKFQDWHP
jgi:hypothetical protein